MKVGIMLMRGCMSRRFGSGDRASYVSAPGEEALDADERRLAP
jgi:hypothetical protein